jgi:hypothetical protein
MISMISWATHARRGVYTILTFRHALQAMAGAYVNCVSYGDAYGCASASASAKAWAKASAAGIAAAWASASSKCCKNTAVVSTEGLAFLQVKLLAMATASADASVCVIGASALLKRDLLLARVQWPVLCARGAVRRTLQVPTQLNACGHGALCASLSRFVLLIRCLLAD